MARIIYALSGQGRGHTSRVMAITDELRGRGHEVRFCCGGTAREILVSRQEDVIEVPALRQVMVGNEVRHGRTMLANLSSVLGIPRIVGRLADEFSAYRPDLLITDFEAFSPKAAARLRLPVISFNHQQVVTETRYHLPAREWASALVTSSAIKAIAPRRPDHILLTSFFFPELKHPERTTLVQPIIRPAVQALRPTRGEHVLVYFNETKGADYILEALREVPASFIVYNFAPETPERYPNLEFKQPSLEGFLSDVASSQGIICTAGFTLISEALFLGKPLLVVPNRGIFEQTINALFLVQDGLGEAVMNRPLRAEDVRGFINRIPDYERRLHGHRGIGNAEAVACIEEVLARMAPAGVSRPMLHYETASNGDGMQTAVKRE